MPSSLSLRISFCLGHASKVLPLGTAVPSLTRALATLPPKPWPTVAELCSTRPSVDDVRPPFKSVEESVESAESAESAEFIEPKEPKEPKEPSALEKLLLVVRTRESSRLVRAFTQWTAVLANKDHPDHEAALQEAICLPTPIVSGIIHALDPFTADYDVAANLNISPGESQYTPNGRLLDKYGIRISHRQVLTGLQILFGLRTGPLALTVADYVVAMRTAGATADYHAVVGFWGDMARNGMQKWRSSHAKNEFLKAFFSTEPLYYQFSRTRVALDARTLVGNPAPIPLCILKQLEKLRLSLHEFKRKPWSCDLWDISVDMMRQLRKRRHYRGFRANWLKTVAYGNQMTEAMLCTSLKAFARSGSLFYMRTLIFRDYYGIFIQHPLGMGKEITITGGRDFNASSLLRPTVALLEAVAEAYGSVSSISLAVLLIQFLSQRYSIPIPHSVWSSLLRWTYVFAAKPFSFGFKILAKDRTKSRIQWNSMIQNNRDVKAVWTVMTTQSSVEELTFGDYDIYIKTLISLLKIDHAELVIREYAMPLYAKLVKDYEAALADEILLADALDGNTPQRAIHRRQRAQTLKDHTHHRITLWFKKIMTVVSKNRVARDGAVGRIILPRLLRLYGYFFPPLVKFATANGVVVFERCGDPTVTHRVRWRRVRRITLPVKTAGFYIFDPQDPEARAQPDFEWPMKNQRLIEEKRPEPHKRLGKMPPPPKMLDSEEGQRWRMIVEKQMMM